MIKKKIPLCFAVGFLFGFLSPEIAKQFMTSEQYAQMRSLGDECSKVIMKILKEAKP